MCPVYKTILCSSKQISSSEYWKLKRELIPEDNSFVDVRWNEDLYYLGEANYDDDGYLLDVKMEKEEIEKLFRLFIQFGLYSD